MRVQLLLPLRMKKNYIQTFRDRKKTAAKKNKPGESAKSQTPNDIQPNNRPVPAPSPVMPDARDDSRPVEPKAVVTSETRQGYRSEDKVWHPQPGTKAYREHLASCKTCTLEAKKLGLHE